ncbi:MAG: hydrogenase maturation protease, partial [Chlorobiales bacterium]|nr:hydrogenase maturation protease [Chlorobiales bacterium]
LVVIVDAMKSKSPVGTVRRFEALREKLGTGMFHYSSHLFGLAEAVEMARVLGQLPKELIIYGIEGASFAFGAPLSPAVAAVLPEVEAKVRREFERG